jgi:hypothetical protein
LYIPLPDNVGRRALLLNLMKTATASLNDADVVDIVAATKGYSGAGRLRAAVNHHLP